MASGARGSAVVALVVVAGLVSGCRTGDGTLDPSGYPQTCASDQECVTVAVGVPEDACCSDCEASAISKGELGKYEHDRASFCAKVACPPGPSCALPPAVCVDGMCTTNPLCTTMLVCPDAAREGRAD